MRLLIATLLLGSVSASSADVTIETLLDEMADLDRLAEFPDPAYTEQQASSYDRASKSPGTSEWFANYDHSQYVRVEERNGEKECVLMDADGPGAIARIWSASAPNGGTLRIYIDGAAEPALEYEMQALMEAKHPAFPSPLSGRRGSGWNLYYPIPYARHCKVTATATPAFYYQVNYRTYAEGTTVESFTMDRAEAAIAKAAQMAARLSNPADPSIDAASESSIDVEIAPGATHVAPAINGPMAIRMLKLKLESDRQYEALRKCILCIAFDDESEPAVDAPIGDFFGTAPGINPYNSLALAVADDGVMTSRWVMPFRSRARIEFRNLDEAPVKITGSVVTSPYTWTPKSLYFHARWRTDPKIRTEPPSDYTILETTGRGRYVGNMLSLANPSMYWWGEGDEKVYVDGESFPSTFGTGSEDYYGYAYGSTEIFHHAYHNQTLCDTPGSFGLVSVNRFHIFDDIPFTKSMKFDLEVWHWDRKIEIAYATTAYWYAGGGAKSAFAELSADNTPVYYRPELFRAEGAVEAEDLQQSVTGGRCWPDQAGIDFSAGHTMHWRDVGEGDTQTYTLPYDKTARCKLIAVVEPNRCRGAFTVMVNNVASSIAHTFRGGPGNRPTEVDLGTYQLHEGENEIVFTCAAVDDQSKRADLGIDYFKLAPAD